MRCLWCKKTDALLLVVFCTVARACALPIAPLLRTHQRERGAFERINGKTGAAFIASLDNDAGGATRCTEFVSDSGAVASRNLDMALTRLRAANPGMRFEIMDASKLGCNEHEGNFVNHNNEHYEIDQVQDAFYEKVSSAVLFVDARRVCGLFLVF